MLESEAACLLALSRIDIAIRGQNHTRDVVASSRKRAAGERLNYNFDDERDKSFADDLNWNGVL